MEGLEVAGADEEDVTVLRGGVVLVAQGFQEPAVADGVGLEGFEGAEFVDLRGREVRGG